MSKSINTESPKRSKARLAESLSVSRAILYYKPTLPGKDLELKPKIEVVLAKHPTYGHRRIAIVLGVNKKRVRRVMKLFGLKPRRMRRIPIKPKDVGQEPMPIPNLLQGLTMDHPNHVWVSDFTYLPYFGKFMYLATVMDAFTREMRGWSVGFRHSKDLVIAALNDALNKHTPPAIFHCDQGSEFSSDAFIALLDQHGIRISMSDKASPWQNGIQESFYSQFKLELGHPENYPTVGELVEGIATQIYYYGHQRIHTSLKCPPAVFAERLKLRALIDLKQEVQSV